VFRSLLMPRSFIIGFVARYLFLLFLLSPALASAAMSNEQIAVLQRQMADRPVGERIAFWAETFVGTPYDPDPLGEYVRKRVIVTEDRVDCMYLAFRVVELALSSDPAGAGEVALDKRFVTKGRVRQGRVLNYEDRFQYGEDMIDSGKWGTEITSSLGKTDVMPGIRGRKEVVFLAAGNIGRDLDLLKSGDIVFFVNPAERMRGGEIVGHIGILKREGGKLYLIHASGRKNGSGRVRVVLLQKYVKAMPFVGIRVTRFETNDSRSE
jgi:hypothetical protein